MAYTIDKSGTIIWSGWEKGIGVSPDKGVANLQSANISSETGEAMVNFSRTQQSMSNTASTGSLAFVDTSHVSLSISGGNNLKGMWITVTGTTHGGELANGDYWVTLSVGSNFQLSATYNGSAITGYTTGLTASFTLKKNMGKIMATATEKYVSGSNVFQYRYYALDSAGLVWVYDTSLASTTDNIAWFLPDTTTLSNATGLTVFNGWLMVFYGNTISCKPTVLLGATPGWASFASGIMTSPATSPNTHFAYVGHQGRIYYTDGVFVGSIFPNTSLLTGISNIQSFASYTTSTTTGTISTLINGSLPNDAASPTTRIPAIFFSDGALATALQTGGTTTLSKIFYILYSASPATFEVYAAATGGSALDITTGASGNQWFNTFGPTNAAGEATITFTPERLTLPAFETATSLVEIDNNILVGGVTGAIYPWDQVRNLPSDILPLPETNIVAMLNVNNIAYIFAGNIGNIYITNGSTVSLALTVPNYCAGIAGTPGSYVEPYFTWGGVMYARGKVFFSILDQTSTKAGNCGGIWSFIPTQNLFIGQDVGIQLVQENQSSYGTYNGYCTALLPSQTQNARSTQYWSMWQSDGFSNITYGIDYTKTSPSTVAVLETDLVPTGTLLDKKTFQQIEYKLTTPLVSGDSVSIAYRQDSTSAYTSLGNAEVESATALSGYFPITFEKGQFLQLKITLTPVGANTSFVRLLAIYAR